MTVENRGGRFVRPAARAARRGLTLIEIMVVILILGIIVTSIAVVGMRVPRGVRQKAAKADIQRLSMALDRYKMQFGKFPPDTGFGLEIEPFENPGTYDPGSLWRYLVEEVYDRRTSRTHGPFLTGWSRNRTESYKDALVGGQTAKYLSDPWGNPYGLVADRKRVIHNRGSFDLFSAGPDGKTACNDGKRNSDETTITDCPSVNENTGFQPPVMGLGRNDNRAYNGLDDDGNGKIDDVKEFGPEAILNGDVGDDINNWSRD